MKKIRIIALILAGLMTVGSLGACVSDTPENPTQDGEQTTPSGANNNGNGEANNSNGNPSNNGNDSADNNGNGNNEATQNYTIDSIEDFNEGIVVYQGTITAEDGSQTVGYGYIDSTGKVITPPIYEKVCVFYKGLAAVVKGENQKGYIDTTGKEVIPCVYSSITSIMDTLAWVTTADGVEQMINAKGEVVYTATGKEVAKGYYKNGFFWVETQEQKLSGNVNTVTYYDKNGEVSSVHEGYSNLGDLSSRDPYGIAYLKDNSSNTYKIAMFPSLYSEEIINVQGSFLRTSVGGLMYIDRKKGELIDSSDLYDADGTYWTMSHMTGNGLDDAEIYLAAPKGTWDGPLTADLRGYHVSRILKGNQLLLDLEKVEEYAGVARFRCVVGWMGTDSKIYFTVRMVSPNGINFFSVIDEEGNVLIAPTTKYHLGYEYKETVNYVSVTCYENYAFSADRCIAKDPETDLFGYIDLTGNWVIPAQYESATDFQGEGDDAVAVVNGNTIINRKGEVIFSVAAEQN